MCRNNTCICGICNPFLVKLFLVKQRKSLFPHKTEKIIVLHSEELEAALGGKADQEEDLPNAVSFKGFPAGFSCTAA